MTEEQQVQMKTKKQDAGILKMNRIKLIHTSIEQNFPNRKKESMTI